MCAEYSVTDGKKIENIPQNPLLFLYFLSSQMKKILFDFIGGFVCVSILTTFCVHFIFGKHFQLERGCNSINAYTLKCKL